MPLPNGGKAAVVRNKSEDLLSGMTVCPAGVRVRNMTPGTEKQGNGHNFNFPGKGILYCDL